MTVSSDPDAKSTGALFSEAVQNVTELVRGEVDLAKAELSQNARRAMSGVMMIAGACVLGVVALNLLAGAGVAALVAQGLSAGWAALVVGGAVFLIAALLVHEGLGAFDRSNLIPRRTLRNVQRDAEQLKEMIHDTKR
jgi:uncharacterized membrane protein YqjE